MHSLYAKTLKSTILCRESPSFSKDLKCGVSS